MLDPVLISRCPSCNGLIRVAAPEYISSNDEARKEFYSEVGEFALKVDTVPKAEMLTMKWCFENDCERNKKSD